MWRKGEDGIMTSHDWGGGCIAADNEDAVGDGAEED